MPNVPLTPQQKKQRSYDRDHYTRGGESKQAWRVAKPLKKRRAIHSVRQKAKQAIAKIELQDSPEEAAARQLGAIKQKKVIDWGVMTLREYVDRGLRRERKIKQG